MHEFELGVWKAIFIHLIRILEADDRVRKTPNVHELDRRWLVFCYVEWQGLVDALKPE